MEPAKCCLSMLSEKTIDSVTVAVCSLTCSFQWSERRFSGELHLLLDNCNARDCHNCVVSDNHLNRKKVGSLSSKVSTNKFQYPIVDVWANPFGLGAAVPEVSRLFAYSHSDPEIADKKRSPKDMIAKMDEAGVTHICLSAWSRPGKMVFSNEEVAEYTRAYPDRIFGLAAVDLHDPVKAVKELEHYVKVEGFVGLRVVPWLWALPPSDPHYWPLFVKCIELDVPFLTQVGHTAPACPSEVGRPIPYIDTIALKFPDLKIIMGHIGYPWAAETVGVAWKHKNVYIDTSAWSPKYYAPEFITFANTTGKSKVMFGTNFPQLGYKACVENVNRYLINTKGGLRDEVVRDFMGGNALRVMKLPPVDLQTLKAKL